MSYKRLFIWVEGDDDLRFFDRIIKPRAQRQYDLVEIITYAEMKKNKIDKYIKSINGMGADYIYIRDINEAPCVTFRRDRIKEKYEILDEKNIVVVIKKIEGWYLAGIHDENATRLKMRKIRKYINTDMIDKGQFNTLMPRRFDSRIDFMIEILKSFSIETAKRKNKSFNYFVEKYKL